MNQSPSKNCPQPALLVEFLQGKLEPPTLDECEAHLENCPQCHETLRGLDTGDTLSEKVAAALIANQPAQDSDSKQVDGLIKRLTSNEFQTRSPAVAQAATSEIMADRAAEVLRCVEPDDETLGIIGDYALLRLIGSGSTGVVFQALDRKLQRTVALKVLRPSLGVLARERFLAEARSAASIEHPNVVTIFQVGQVDRLAFIAMQWSPGQTLETKLQSGVCFDESQVTGIISKVASGLAAAHQKQVVHRDIKPANLWVCDSDDQIKILDFGLARISDDNPGLTATGMLAGTPNFMSPEQARGLELDGRSDLFSLGCLMYQLLTGRLPFGGPTVLATLQSVQNQSPTPPHQIKPDVPQHLSDLTMCLLEKQPANRPESAHQLIEMLSTTRKDWPITVNQYLGTPEEETEVAHNTSGKIQGQSGGMRWLIAGLLLGLAGWGAWLWAPQILRVITDQGEVVIESKADDVEVQVFADGKLIRVVDTQTQQSFDLKSGKYTFAARSSGDEKNTFTISPNQLTMSRGSTQIVKVTTPAVGVGATRPGDSPDTGRENPPNPARLHSLLSHTRDQLREWPLRISLEWQRTLKAQGFLYAPISGEERDSIGEIILFQEVSSFKNRSIINSNQLTVYKNTAIVDIDDLTLQELQQRTLSLRNLDGKDLTGVVLRYVRKDGSKVDIRSVVNIPGNAPVVKTTSTDEKRAKYLPERSAGQHADKPVFKNQTFEHWLRISRRDRDVATRTDALKACAATAETEADVESLITLSRKLCRKHGSNVIGNNAESDLYYRALAKVINSLDTDQIVEFIETEIADGTEPSRHFCSLWLARVADGVIPREWISKTKSVNERAGQLGDSLASHLEKPGNSWILNSLVDTANKKKLTGKALATALKRLAADPDQRRLLQRSILLLLSDVDVFTLYRDDLLDTKTHPAIRMKLFNTMFHNSGQNRSLPRQRQQLLFDLADGVLQKGEQRLEFAREFVTSVEDVLAEEIVARVLIELNRFDQEFDAQFKTETLLPQLVKLKAAVEKAANDPERTDDFIPANAKILLADFDYMIKVASGDSDAEIQEEGFLKRGVYDRNSSTGGFGGGGGGVF